MSMPEVEINGKGEYKFTIQPDDIPANPPNAAEMTPDEAKAEHFRRLESDPTFKPGVAPESWRFHDEITWEQEVEGCYGKRWGNQGIGKLREVIVTRPSDNEFLDVFFDDSAGYMEQWTPERPDPDVWFEQFEILKKNYRDNDVLVHEVIVPKITIGPYGHMRWWAFGADTGSILNGGAVIPRAGYFGSQKGRETVWQKVLALMDIPILYTVRGRGVAELGGQVWLDNHHMIVSDGTIMNLEGARQLKQVFAMSDAKLIQIPTSGHYQLTAFPSGGTSHVDMVLTVPKMGLVVIYPPYTGFATVKFFNRLGFDIIEIPSEEYLSGVYNAVVLEPGKVMIPTKGAPRTIKAMEEAGIEIVPTEMTEGMKAGGLVKCSTCMARRDPGPVCEPLLETPLERLAPELAVPDWEKDWSTPAFEWGYSLEGMSP
jgi:N-dimethylarginine dimethylaminohydrolase